MLSVIYFGKKKWFSTTDEFRDWYQDYLRSDHWQRKRNEALSHWAGCCFECEDNTDIEVHHLNYQHLGEERLLDDILALCDRCHDKEHKRNCVINSLLYCNNLSELISHANQRISKNNPD